jgi:hypothetical protein
MDLRLSVHNAKQSLAELLVSGGLPTPDMANYRLFNEAHLACLQPGTVLFVETVALKMFFYSLLPMI